MLQASEHATVSRLGDFLHRRCSARLFRQWARDPDRSTSARRHPAAEGINRKRTRDRMDGGMPPRLELNKKGRSVGCLDRFAVVIGGVVYRCAVCTLPRNGHASPLGEYACSMRSYRGEHVGLSAGDTMIVSGLLWNHFAENLNLSEMSEVTNRLSCPNNERKRGVSPCAYRVKGEVLRIRECVNTFCSRPFSRHVFCGWRPFRLGRERQGSCGGRACFNLSVKPRATSIPANLPPGDRKTGSGCCASALLLAVCQPPVA